MITFELIELAHRSHSLLVRRGYRLDGRNLLDMIVLVENIFHSRRQVLLLLIHGLVFITVTLEAIVELRLISIYIRRRFLLEFIIRIISNVVLVLLDVIALVVPIVVRAVLRLVNSIRMSVE